MTSLLAVCSKPETISELEKLASEAGYRLRTVSTLTAAEEWPALQQFEAVLVEDGFGEQETVQFFEAVWKSQRLTECILFNLADQVKNPWEAVLIGVEVFSGKRGFVALKHKLSVLQGLVSVETLDKLGVLVVDDLDAPRDILCAYVQALGFPNVTGVGSAEAALKALRDPANSFFTVLSDLAMPQRSGINLLHEIRSSSNLRRLPVIICTAYPTADNLVRSIVEGASGFMIKPPKRSLLLAELDKARRFFRTKRDPRLCPAQVAPQFEEAMRRRGLI